jgi:hypothetical protein
MKGAGAAVGESGDMELASGSTILYSTVVPANFPVFSTMAADK